MHRLLAGELSAGDRQPAALAVRERPDETQQHGEGRGDAAEAHRSAAEEVGPDTGGDRRAREDEGPGGAVRRGGGSRGDGSR